VTRPVTGRRLRAAVLGAGHWHAHYTYEALAASNEVALVAVADPNGALVQRIARDFNCAGYADHVTLLDRERVDVAFVYGRPCDMHDLGGAVIERGIPFAIEKPGGVNSHEVADLRDRAARRGLFANVAFTFRMSAWMDRVRSAMQQPGNAFRYGSFRLISGPPDRYLRDDVAWNLDRRLAGGGSTMNLAVHFVDLFGYLVGGPVVLKAVTLEPNVHGVAVEDHSFLMLAARSGDATCVIETGYTLPAYRRLELNCVVRTSGEYFLATNGLLSVTRNGEETLEKMRTTNADYYPDFAIDTVRRVRDGIPPLADLGDMLETIRVVEDAYRAAGLDPVRSAIDR
jgi:predicted dehydrogenase